MRSKFIKLIKELVDRIKFMFELRAFEKEKIKEDLLLDKMIKEQEEIDRLLDTKYSDDLTNKQEQE
jgi:hypothetical protein